MIKRLLLLVCLLVPAIWAQPATYPHNSSLASDTTNLVAIPTSPTAVVSSDAWITGITLIGAASGSTIHVTLTCTTSGNPVLNGTGIPITTLYPVAVPYGIFCRGGFSISADSTGAYYQISFSK